MWICKYLQVSPDRIKLCSTVYISSNCTFVVFRSLKMPRLLWIVQRRRRLKIGHYLFQCLARIGIGLQRWYLETGLKSQEIIFFIIGIVSSCFGFDSAPLYFPQIHGVKFVELYLQNWNFITIILVVVLEFMDICMRKHLLFVFRSPNKR